MQLNHGFLILDKPLGITSAKAVSEVKKILKCKKIGHGGTLDPLASGILPLAIGEATKAFDYVASSIKEYRFTVTFGEERDTGDAEGAVTETTQQLPTAEELLAVLPEFTGIIMQTPPVYSALKINGERAYERARAGEVVEMIARPVNIQELKLISYLPPQGKVQQAAFGVTCGKGMYVRSLGRDIARKVNSLAYISMLRRTRVGKFQEGKAILLDKLAEIVHSAALFEAWVPIELALDDIPAIDMDANLAQKMRHGQTALVNNPDGKYMALHQGRIVALVQAGQGVLKPVRVFNVT